MDLMKMLSHNSVFGCLSEPERDKLMQTAITKGYQKGEYLTYTGDIWPYLFFLAEGSIDAVKESYEGRSLVAISFRPGDVFWGVAFFHPEYAMPVALRAESPSRLYLWSRQELLPVLMENGRLAWELSRLMVTRMLRASEIVEELAFQPVAGRLARLLIDYPGQSARGPISRSLTLDDMAARIGSTREMVCRFLQRFADENLIKITRTEFEITNRERLADIAQKTK